MKREELVHKVALRRKQLAITLENLATLSNLGYRTIARFFANEDITLSSVEKITNTLGLDFAGNEVIDAQTLKEQRAEVKALYIVSLVQDTSSLEKQGLDEEQVKKLLQETKAEFLTGKYQKQLWSS
jgi:transcriptional regulator with XRE-family HTH domain